MEVKLNKLEHTIKSSLSILLFSQTNYEQVRKSLTKEGKYAHTRIIRHEILTTGALELSYKG